MSKNNTTSELGVKVEGVDDVYVHSVPIYLETTDLTLVEYQETYPDAPLYSDAFLEAKSRREAASGKKIDTISADMTASVTALPTASSKRDFASIFGLGKAPAAKNARGEAIKCTVLGHKPEFEDFMPDIDDNYIFPIDKLKTVMIAAELNKPMLLWGMHGTGKTTLIEQYCARTKRPWVRVQHTVGTEESHVVGQYIVKDGATQFEYGPLAIAMREGLVYVADEYDFALPSVTSVYQSVLEGKPLYIKEAPEGGRLIRPHPNFRFYATGNTNGAGDETGLYSGTQIMNAANYSRFGITIEMNYMDTNQETAVVASQAKVARPDAAKLVKVANEVRRAFERGEISTTISPRELINAAELGKVFGLEPDLSKGLELAFCNRLDSTDRKAVNDFAQRHFG